MFEPNNSIIIVDDSEIELIALSKAFNLSGISCRTIQYDLTYTQPLKGVRIAFFDINLTNKSFDATQKIFDYKNDSSLSAAFNDLANAIQNCIDKDSAPFGLIFWSKHTGVIENFKTYVRERRQNLPSPILIDSIDKTEFMDKTAEEIKTKIVSIISKTSVKLLFEFENICISSASSVVNDIYKIIPQNPNEEDRVWANNVGFEENFEKIFSKIALKTLGKDAIQNPDKAISEALIPVLNYSIIKNISLAECWKNHLTTLTSGQPISYPLNFNEGVLNSIFHIDTSDRNKEQRGSVILIDKSNELVLKSLQIDNFSTWFNILIPFKINKQLERDSAFNNCKLVVVELSAACDFQQKNLRINKFIMGIMIPKIDVENLIDKQRKESSYHIGKSNFHFGGNDFQIWLNLNFVFGAKSDDTRLGEPLFILKKEIMDMIGHKYASHVSRIGITCF